MDGIAVQATIEMLCEKFNVSAEYIIPRMQAYKMAMCQFGFITAAIFVVAIGIFCGRLIFKISKEEDLETLIGMWVATVIAEAIPIIVLLANIYDYIGWRYAPEVKMIEYVASLIKR